MLPLLITCALFISVHAITPEVTAAAALGMVDGATLNYTTVNYLLDDDFLITCVIEVENWTKFPLNFPRFQINHGTVPNPPVPIRPGVREVMVGRKTGFTATGSSGTVSWEIQGKNRRFVVLWEVPFDYNFYENLLGVGLTAVGYITHPSGNTWYNQMSEGQNSDVLNFSEKSFEGDLTPINYISDGFEIMATMNNAHDAHVKILFTPTNTEDLAPSILEHLVK